MLDLDLLGLIGGRRVIVDACVSREIANRLRANGLVVRHVVEINPRLSDDQIVALMHSDEVLITRDQKFYRAIGMHRAILLPSPSGPGGKTAANGVVHRRKKLPSHIRLALREKMNEEATSGILYIKILWCIIWLSLPVV